MDTSRCVLVVDDDRNDIFFLRRGFHRAGLTTDFLDVPDGLLAIQYLRGTPPYDDRGRFPFPNLLLLDIKMPRISGLEVLAWLTTREDMKELPALVLTSSSRDADREMAAKLGAREFLLKPTDPSDWIKLAQGLHKRWLALQDGAEQSWRGMPSGEGALGSLLIQEDDHAIADAAVRGGLFG